MALAFIAAIQLVAKVDRGETVTLRKDDTHGSWLPAEKSSGFPEVETFLASLNGQMRVLGAKYDGNQLVGSKSFVAGSLDIGEAALAAEASVTSEDGHLDISVTFKLIAGAANSFGVAVAFDFTGWNTENYILAPAQIYGGNRFRIYDTNYPPYIQDESDRPLDMPVTTTNILHLNQDGSRAKVEMNTGNLSTPMLAFFQKKAKRSFILLTEQATRFGNSGLIIEEDAGPGVVGKRASFVVGAPGVRGQRYRMVGRADTDDRGGDWKPGDELTLRLSVYNFECPDLECFYAKVFDVRKALSGKNGYDNVTPFSVAASLVLDHHDTSNWFAVNGGGFYNYLPGSTVPYHNQIGWAGVPIHSFPSLIAETPERLRRVRMSMDSAVIGMQAKTGLYYAMSDGHGAIFGDTHATMAQHPAVSMTRRTMDVIYFGVQTIDLMRQRGRVDQINPEWDHALRKAADALLKVWDDYGQFGQTIDVETGKMGTNGSTAGAAAGAALALASRHFNDPRYLAVAEAAMKMYYERDFQNGYAGGGAAEILQSPDSETAWDMLESCMVLYEINGRREWVQRAEFVTQMLATWVVSYDYRFPKGSMMEHAGTRATGSIFASSQNNHAAPGYFILSGDSLLKLYRATGDQRYAELYKDQSHNVIQYMGAPHSAFRRQPGYVTERVQLSDWEGKESIGNINEQASDISWETLVALTCLENPGIYLRIDSGQMIVLDHVEAQILDSDRQHDSKTMRLKNPTEYDASVSIFAETAAKADEPLGWGAYDKWPRIEIKAGETKVIRIDYRGMIEP